MGDEYNVYGHLLLMFLHMVFSLYVCMSVCMCVSVSVYDISSFYKDSSHIGLGSILVISFPSKVTFMIQGIRMDISIYIDIYMA